MHRADTAGSVAGRFVDADDTLSVRGADLDADFLNDVQESLCAFIDREGTGFVKGDRRDFRKALDHAYAVKSVPALAQDGTTVEVVNTVTPGEIVRFTVPGGTLTPGRRLRVRAIGERSANTAVTFAARFGSPSSPPVTVVNGVPVESRLQWRIDVDIAALEGGSEVVIVVRLNIEGHNCYSDIAAGYAADLTDDLDVILTAALPSASPTVFARSRHYSAELI